MILKNCDSDLHLGSYNNNSVLVFSYPEFNLKFQFDVAEKIECWGITMDLDNNYIITDVKSNSVIFFNSEGEYHSFRTNSDFD